jgi:hypothetical protein
MPSDVSELSSAVSTKADTLTCMTARVYGFAVGLAVAVGLLAWVASYKLDLPLRDPDGLAGPAYIRLPAIVIFFFAADVVPRVLIQNRGARGFWAATRAYTKERWTRSRIVLVIVGLLSFYVTYVAYRNLKGFLPFVRPHVLNDKLLLSLDKALCFGHYPAVILHQLLGTGFMAGVLSTVYVAFLMFVPVTLGAALVWSRNPATGFWYVIALCCNWILGVGSYYWMPSLGPVYAKPSLFTALHDTGAYKLQMSLEHGRENVLSDPGASHSLQSIAAFASLHVSVILTAAMIVHLVIPNRWVRYGMWVYFALTCTSTVYFGWHYLLDDAAGLAIGYISVVVGAKVTGHSMHEKRRHFAPDENLVGVFPPATGPVPDAAELVGSARLADSPANRPSITVPADPIPVGRHPTLGTADPTSIGSDPTLTGHDSTLAGPDLTDPAPQRSKPKPSREPVPVASQLAVNRASTSSGRAVVDEGTGWAGRNGTADHQGIGERVGAGIKLPSVVRRAIDLGDAALRRVRRNGRDHSS